MPAYVIRHVTRYLYNGPVSVCHSLAHLLPRTSPHHHWSMTEVSVTPTPAVRHERFDVFGNPITFFVIQEPHRQLEVIATSKVEVDRPPTPTLFETPPWEHVRQILASACRGELLDAYQFTFDSPCIPSYDEVAAYARPSFTPSRPVLDAALDLCTRIHVDFVYDPAATTIYTSLPEVLSARRGVCQDFAHLMVASLRAMGLAARYVSGYMLTLPPPGQPRLVGADASHAWASVYVPSNIPGKHGEWVDLDPTNAIIPADKHVTIAWGRDFGDVSPLRGVILGGGQHTVSVAVDVMPVPTTEI
jgi:transglutaminase-like putative cysteine protease